MCITSENALLQNTYIGVWDIQHQKYGYRHVLAYQNTPIDLSDKPNCMLLHIPSKEALSPENVFDTSDCSDFLRTIVESVLPPPPPDWVGFRGRGQGKNYVFEMGVYHIAILNHVSEKGLEEALVLVPNQKRPQISKAFLDFFQDNFSNYPLLLCCFNNKAAAVASPIMVHFNPIYPDIFMFNTLDSHGKIPEIGSSIRFPQKLLIASQFLKQGDKNGLPLDISKASERLKPFLPTLGLGHTFMYDDLLPNADIIISRNEFLSTEDIGVDFNLLPKYILGESVM